MGGGGGQSKRRPGAYRTAWPSREPSPSMSLVAAHLREKGGC